MLVPARKTNIWKYLSLVLDYAFNLEPNIQARSQDLKKGGGGGGGAFLKE